MTNLCNIDSRHFKTIFYHCLSISVISAICWICQVKLDEPLDRPSGAPVHRRPHVLGTGKAAVPSLSSSQRAILERNTWEGGKRLVQDRM
jgi:hypothetical protein